MCVGVGEGGDIGWRGEGMGWRGRREINTGRKVTEEVRLKEEGK